MSIQLIPSSTARRIVATDLAAKKPGTGLSPNRADELIGRRLNRNLERDDQILVEYVEPDLAEGKIGK